MMQNFTWSAVQDRNLHTLIKQPGIQGLRKETEQSQLELEQLQRQICRDMRGLK